MSAVEQYIAVGETRFPQARSHCRTGLVSVRSVINYFIFELANLWLYILEFDGITKLNISKETET